MKNNSLQGYVDKNIQANEEKAKSVQSASEKREEFELKKDQDEAETRQILSKWLRWISVIWLIFTSIVIVLYGLEKFKFPDSVAITFISSSLLEVFALWKIALNYFFDR